jgi:hypothetical protein
LTIETIGTTDDPTQLHQTIEKVEAFLQQAEEDTVQATQVLAQVQSEHIVQQKKEK